MPKSDYYNQKAHKLKSLKLRDYEFNLSSKTLIMGIMNVTPDSFFDGGKYITIQDALRHIDTMVENGADIIDIGGESTKPGSLGVSEELELETVIPVIKEAARRFNVPLSIDTTKSHVARNAISEGASLINDISGLKFDPQIADVAAKSGAGLVVMHTPSRPSDMQKHTNYAHIIEDIKDSLKKSIETALKSGVNEDSIIIDPGFGFGKTVKQNLILLRNLGKFLDLEKPILIGTSMKSFIRKVIGTDISEDRLQGTAATVAIGIMNGASIVRVHDVRMMKFVSKMTDAVLSSS